MKKVVSFLRDSNISEYTNIMSSEDVIKSLLESQSAQQAAQTTFVDESIKDNDELIKILADVFQSLTTKAMTTREIIEYIYDNYKPNLGKDVNKELNNFLGDSIKIVHANNYKLNCNNAGIKELRDATPFVLAKELPSAESAVKVDGKWVEIHYYYHFLNDDNTKETSRFGLNQLIKNAPDNSGQILFDYAKKTDEDDVGGIFNCEEMIDAKVERTDSITGNISERTYFNARDLDNNLIENKDNTSVSVVMLNNPNIRAGTKNSLEMSTFLNILSTIELSKCQPYFNATFILPDSMQNLTGKKFKTASITQFLEGTIDVPWDNAVSDLYNTLEASFVREINRKKDEEFIESTGTATNMSAFTMPQTINNFDEVFVGHDEVIQLNRNRLFKRANQIHDITRPFMTIKSFNVDVSPTQGLMSFKTGKLSLVLHDRTRMVDIAPFIKPDLFGSFGSEISIEYGWSHIDAQKLSEELKEKDVNHIAEFLDKTRVIEKYIITNSSFKITGNGQVDIDLSIAMRGPIDIRTVFLDIDAPKKISHDNAIKRKEKFRANKNNIFIELKGGQDGNNTTFHFSNTPSDVLFANILTVTEDTNFDTTVTKKINDFNNHLKKFKNNILTIDTQNKKTMEKFVEELNEAWKLADKDFNTTYFDPTADIFVLHQGSSQSSTTTATAAEITPRQQKDFINEVLIKGKNSYEKLVGAVSSNINGVIGARRKTQNSLVKQLIGGLGEVDPFYDKDWLKQYYLYSQDQADNETIDQTYIKENKLPIYGIKPYGSKIKKKGETSVVSFGSIVVAIITSHLACIGKFDEIQIVSYTANSFCGLMSNRNIMSFLIDRKELTDFLFNLFSKEAKYTIEAIMTQICQRFISTRDQICYGIKSLYTRDGDKSIRPRNQNVKKHQKDVNDALQRIYEGRTPSDNTSDSLKKVVFLMPKIKFSFDTLTTKESGYLKTISRISIFDQQDNPFGSVKEIMEKVYDENIILAAAEINRLRAEMFSKNDKEKDKNNKRNSTIDAFYDKSNKIVQDLIDKEIIIREGDSFRVAGSFKTNSLKQEFKKIMPSATYGTQNNTLLDASISTINEANLNTVYLTRPDRNTPDSLAKISFGNDLPLRILPAQADITLYGCPFVNFAQYIFLDFETGTTVDNTYAVTGIKHDMSPGKFTTSLTLSYGDVYGKYENAVSTIKKILREDNQKSSIRFFGGNIRLEGIDGTKMPDDIANLTSLTLDKDNFTFVNNSKFLDNTIEPNDKIINNLYDNEFIKNVSNFAEAKANDKAFKKINVIMQVFAYKQNKIFASVKKENNNLVLDIKAAIDYKTTYNKNIYYKIPIKYNKLSDYLSDFFQYTNLVTKKRSFEIINRNIVKNAYNNKDEYFVKTILDIIKLKFNLSLLFENESLMFYYYFKIKPLTTGSFDFDPRDSKIGLDFPDAFSVFDSLSAEKGDEYFYNEISLDLSKKKKLFYEIEDNKITSIKILRNKKTENKLPIEVKYNTKVKKVTKTITKTIYFFKDDDRNITKEFKDQVLSLLNNNIFNFKLNSY